MTRGLYLSQLAIPRPAAAEAADFIRTGAVVSLQTVLGEAGITNNFSDVVTSVLPHERRHVSSVRPCRRDPEWPGGMQTSHRSLVDSYYFAAGWRRALIYVKRAATAPVSVPPPVTFRLAPWWHRQTGVTFWDQLVVE